MNYKNYCTLNKVDPDCKRSAKMYHFYKEAEAASTDFKKKKMKDSFPAIIATNNANVHYNAIKPDWIIMDEYVQFATLPVATPCNVAECKPWPIAKQKEGNNPMYVDNDKHIESSKINYLSDRLSVAVYKQEADLVKTFNLDTPKTPETAEALVDAITKGNYTIKPKNECSSYDRVTNQILWRAPTVVPDQVGYETAISQVRVLKQVAQDTIAVGTPADALVAIKAIDAFVPTVTA